MRVLDVLLSAAAAPAVGGSLYLGALALLARHRPPGAGAGARLRFDVIVPAHNEESTIEATVRSLLAIEYPSDRFRVIVVADNCTDGTAQRASSAGARVLVRNDPDRRGKGYALAHGFETSLREAFADAAVVVDADTFVSSNLLSAFAVRFETGAQVLQADYGVRNSADSWRTRLMTIALAAFHGVRSLGRERLRLSCGLRGNGMAFSRAVLGAHPPRAFSIVEDLEYGIHLGYAGIRVEYVHDAAVQGLMAVTEGASRSQRRRWERGRQALVRAHLGPLLSMGWKRRDPRLIDLALDLLVPPLAQFTMVILVGLTVALATRPLGVLVAPWLWGAALAGVALHVARGWQISGVGLTGLVDLLWAPAYMVWKISLRFRDKGETPQEWVRTSREVGQ